MKQKFRIYWISNMAVFVARNIEANICACNNCGIEFTGTDFFNNNIITFYSIYR